MDKEIEKACERAERKGRIKKALREYELYLGYRTIAELRDIGEHLINKPLTVGGCDE